MARQYIYIQKQLMDTCPGSLMYLSDMVESPEIAAYIPRIIVVERFYSQQYQVELYKACPAHVLHLLYSAT